MMYKYYCNNVKRTPPSHILVLFNDQNEDSFEILFPDRTAITWIRVLIEPTLEDYQEALKEILAEWDKGSHSGFMRVIEKNRWLL